MTVQSSTDAPPQSPPDKPSWQWDLFTGLLPGLALAPMLLFEASALWSKPHMRFFPLTIVAIVAIVVLNWRNAEATTAPARRWTAISAFILASGCFLYSVLAFSPWLAHLAAVLCFFGWSLGRWGNTHWGSVAGWASLLATTLPLPFGWDEAVLAWLQGVATWATTCSLDALQIACLRNGNLLEIKGLTIAADEICDIWGGLYAMLSLAAILMAFQHRGLLVSLKVLSLVPFWVLLANYFRMLAVAIAHENYGIDAAFGRDFLLLAVGTTIMTVFLIWLSSMFFRQWFSPIPVADAEFGPIFSTINKAFYWPLPDPLEEIPPEDEDDLKIFKKRQEKKAEAEANRPKFHWLNNPISTWLVRGVAIVFVAGGGMGLAAFSGGQQQLNFGRPQYSIAQVENIASEDAMPASLAESDANAPNTTWQRSDFSTIRRSPRSSLGEYGLRWSYINAQQTLTVGVDFPFVGWHDPVVQLERRGWKVLKSQIEVENDWPYGEAELENELGGLAYLFYANYSVDGSPFDRAPGLAADSFQPESSAGEITQTAQLFVEAGEELSEADLKIHRDQFLSLRQQALEVRP